MEYYVYTNGKKLRCGFTTGSCATLAAKAAAIMLLSKEKVQFSEILTPKGIKVKVDIVDVQIHDNYIQCGVIKDAGDDIDATDKALICAKVSLCEKGIHIKGGVGVGIITSKGLEQPINNPAINSVPRKMIFENLTQVANIYNYSGGFVVEISVPNGENIAKKTFNENLGIKGGISILGTTGIVEPQSIKALIDSIEVELKMLSKNNIADIIISPGNYSENYIKNSNFYQKIPNVKCSNFIGETLDLASIYNFKNILLIGHIGKFAKLAAGIMNTHSRVADGRVHIFASYAALCGASQKLIQEIMESKTTDACIEILKKESIDKIVLEKIIESAQNHINYRTDLNVGILMYSNVYGLLGQSNQADKIIERWKNI